VQPNTQAFDVTARKFHQGTCVLLMLIAFLVGPAAGRWLVALVGVVMLGGRYWWPLDIFRQFTWRVLEPAGVLKRREVHEDHATRRIARVIGGVVFLVAAALLSIAPLLAWILVAAIAVMIFLDGAFDL
jgi:uncharacterized membrane protein